MGYKAPTPTGKWFYIYMKGSPVNPTFCVLIRKGRKTQTNEIFQEVASYDAYQNLILK